MTHGRSNTTLALLAPLAALVAAPVHAGGLLDPTRIARGYTAVADPAACLGWLVVAPVGPPTVREAPPGLLGVASRGSLSLGEGPSAVGSDATPAPARTPDTFEEATHFTATGVGLAGNLSRLQDTFLPVRIGAHSVTSEDALFAGLDALEGRGRTFRALDGRVLGDLSFSIGAGVSRAGVVDWWYGIATLEDLNPFRDLSAQLDIAVLTDAVLTDPRGNAPLVVLRLRATYLGAFGGAGGATSSAPAWGEEGAAEFGVSVGLKF